MHVFHMYLTWDMCVLLMNEVLSVVGDTSSPWNWWSRADVSKIHAAEWNVDRMLSKGLALFFSGAMMIVILETDDQMVRCGSRSSGRGLFEETVAMCAMLVGGARCACAFRKLRFGDVVYLHAFHAFSAFPVEVHLILCLLLPCRVRCIVNAQGSVLDWHARHSDAVLKKIGTRVRHACCKSGTLCACVVCCRLLSRCVTSGVVGSFTSWHP